MQKPQRTGDQVAQAPQYPIESVDNALKLILLFGERPEVRLTEAGRYLGVATSTAHRLLAMLQYRGFVRQDAATKVYRPGPALTGVAFSIMGRTDINRLARPTLLELAATTQESVHLGTLEGANVRFLDAVESSRAVRVASRLGKSLPAHCTSLGKVLLADLPEPELHRLYSADSLVQVTSNSIDRRVDLEVELARARRRGYATNREESEDGVASVAVAVPSRVPSLRLGLSIAAPIGRLPAKKVKDYAAVLVEAAAELGDLIG